MRRGNERILTTHTGSLPRDPALLEILQARELSELGDAGRHDDAIRAAVEHSVQEQLGAGLDVINDGEQSKLDFETYRYRRLSGFEMVDGTEAGLPPWSPPVEAQDFPQYYERWVRIWNTPEDRSKGHSGPWKALCCTGPIGWRDFAAVERDIANLKAATTDSRATEIFMTAISPGTYLPPNLHYPNDSLYLDAMADTMAHEYAAIIESGFLLQIDAPDLTTFYQIADVPYEEFRERTERCVEAINRAVRNLPTDRIRVHVCWGCDEAPHHRDVPLAKLLPMLLRLAPEGLSIPSANGQHAWEWRIWTDVKLPDEKVLIPGIIDSTTNIIEHPETVADRIVRYAEIVGRDRVIAGVDCGFGTVGGIDQVDERVAFAKLRSLADGAALASQRLW